MNFLFKHSEHNIFKYQKNEKKTSTIFNLLLFNACMRIHVYMSKHVYAKIYIVLILLRTSEIIFSIYTRAISINFNHYFGFAIRKFK